MSYAQDQQTVDDWHGILDEAASRIDQASNEMNWTSARQTVAQLDIAIERLKTARAKAEQVSAAWDRMAEA